MADEEMEEVPEGVLNPDIIIQTSWWIDMPAN
jgi:hypothetical protein